MWRTTVGVPAARWHRIMLAITVSTFVFLDFFACKLIHINCIVSVSYTHLTLPTSDLV